MGKECFTCANKLSTELTQEERKEMKEVEKAKGIKFPRIPEMIFHCKITGKQINQTDPACDNYEADDFMVDLRKDIGKVATKLRKELEM